MSKIKIRKIRSEMPHARLFLDDLREIEALIRSACAALPEPREVVFTYYIDEETRLTEMDDLKEHSGFISELTVSMSPVSGDYGYGLQSRLLRFHSWMNPDLDLPSALEDQKWALTGQIEQIFQSRRDRLKAVCDAISHPITYGVSGVLIGCFPLAIFELIIRFLKHPPASENVPLLFLSLAGSVVGLAFWYGGNRTNGVYLHESREQQLARSQTRNALLGKLAWLIVTAAISTAGTLLVAHQTGHLK